MRKKISVAGAALAALAAALLVTTNGAASTTGSWQTVLNDNFSTLTSIPSHWHLRNSSDPNHSNHFFAPQHCFISGGHLNMLLRYEPSGLNGFPAGWYSCNLTTTGISEQADQRVTVVWKAVSTNGGSSHYLMPVRWPGCSGLGEEDWYEGQNGVAHSFMHYGGSTSGCLTGSNTKVLTLGFPTPDLTNYHFYVFQRITTGSNVTAKAFVDGKQIYSCNATTKPACNTTTMPAVNKTTGLQQNIPAGGAPPDTNGGNDGTVDYQVLSVKIDNWVP